MTRPQAAICAEGECFGIFLTLTMDSRPDSVAAVRKMAGGLHGLTQDLAERLKAPGLVSAIGFGRAVWNSLFDFPPPALLADFAALSSGPRHAPATRGDLLIHIHSERHDANFALARAIMDRLGPSLRVEEEIHGFKTFGGRDLTGFVDGTENPKGEERAEVALVGDEDPAFAGGSYVSIQRYVHDLAGWNHLPVASQELAVGRTKVDDLELDDAVKPPSAHIARVVIEENGAEIQILRHSLPYGTTGENGLYFVAYGRSPRPFRRMLEAMVLRDEAGHHDRLLDFTRAVTGASFFAPSLDLLGRLAD